ncbi:MAG: ABC transporter ATP-binding protein [Candidatus Dormibacteraeota bacterium]|uniref:ABC transporter ATP-binding protein n=1 Tax=Candidatus Aeolococcus gillhamiae TaxID=3127015 RepID=A0A934JUW1_9BACT|nr:ABC transporter ATP-binding protein [Candidatus Dormibacteraeota bacterium]
MKASIVDCEGLVHIYKAANLEVVALQGLDLEVAPGEMVAIAGRSGSGKTTLMNILAGLERPTAGVVRVAGNDLSRLSGSEQERYRRDVVGYVLQHAMGNLAPYLTAIENVQAATVTGTARGRSRAAASLLERLGLGARLSRRPGELAGHENQRLALATALANHPRLLLADEPTAELDTAAAAQLLGDLTTVLREEEAAAVIVTHDPQLETYVDRVVMIRDGRTSSERRWVEREGALIHDELAIMDRAGRIQLPRAYVDKLGLSGRVRLHLEGDRISILPATGDESA